MDEILWKKKYFNELTTSELYEILSLRNTVFVVEQDCVYLDTDKKDAKALHLIGKINEQIVAYCRLFRAGDYFNESSIGRVVTHPDFRRKGYGDLLLKNAIEAIHSEFNEISITISAQYYLKSFYEHHGFIPVGNIYKEDGIDHIQMKKYE